MHLDGGVIGLYQGLAGVKEVDQLNDGLDGKVGEDLEKRGKYLCWVISPIVISRIFSSITSKEPI
jgi:hypothetical protein